LLNIHIQAMQNPQFADAIAHNWLTQSAAALLARPSTPPELIDELLAAPAPPTKAGIEARLRKPKPAQNPHSADYGGAIPPPAIVELSPAQAVITAARTFTTQQRAFTAQWSSDVIISQAAHRQALDHIDALLALLE
jgi:hypothetical protein